MLQGMVLGCDTGLLDYGSLASALEMISREASYVRQCLALGFLWCSLHFQALPELPGSEFSALFCSMGFAVCLVSEARIG